MPVERVASRIGACCGCSPCPAGPTWRGTREVCAFPCRWTLSRIGKTVKDPVEGPGSGDGIRMSHSPVVPCLEGVSPPTCTTIGPSHVRHVGGQPGGPGEHPVAGEDPNPPTCRTAHTDDGHPVVIAGRIPPNCRCGGCPPATPRSSAPMHVALVRRVRMESRRCRERSRVRRSSAPPSPWSTRTVHSVLTCSRWTR